MKLRKARQIVAAYKDGSSVGEVAKRCHVCREWVRIVLHRAGLKDYPIDDRMGERLEEIKLLWSGGATLTEISSRYGKTHEWARLRLALLGIQPKDYRARNLVRVKDIARHFGVSAKQAGRFVDAVGCPRRINRRLPAGVVGKIATWLDGRRCECGAAFDPSRCFSRHCSACAKKHRRTWKERLQGRIEALGAPPSGEWIRYSRAREMLGCYGPTFYAMVECVERRRVSGQPNWYEYDAGQVRAIAELIHGLLPQGHPPFPGQAREPANPTGRRPPPGGAAAAGVGEGRGRAGESGGDGR